MKLEKYYLVNRTYITFMGIANQEHEDGGQRGEREFEAQPEC